MEILDRLEKYWYPEKGWFHIQRGAQTVRPETASERDLSNFETENQVVLPSDLREYLLRLNGTDVAGDDQLLRFWPIQDIRPVDRKGFNLAETERYFYFADFLIESHYYAIYLGNDSRLQNQVILPDFPGYPILANSFTEFLELYLRDDPKLFGNF